MKLKITEKDKKFLRKVWKDGEFLSYKFIGIGDIIKKLERLGILKKTGQFKYDINRERYIKLESREYANELKQKKLE